MAISSPPNFQNNLLKKVSNNSKNLNTPRSQNSNNSNYSLPASKSSASVLTEEEKDIINLNNPNNRNFSSFFPPGDQIQRFSEKKQGYGKFSFDLKIDPHDQEFMKVKKN